MRSLFQLLLPYRVGFMLALAAMVLSSLFNSALTVSVKPLMDSVLVPRSDPAGEVQDVSKDGDVLNGLFQHSRILTRLTDWLKSSGIVARVDELKSSSQTHPLAWAAMVFVIFLLQLSFEFLGTLTMSRVGLKVVVGLRNQLIEHLMTLSLGFFERSNTGDLLSRISNDVLKIQNAISSRLGELFKEAANALVFTILAFVIDWKLSLTLFLLVPLIGLPLSVLSKKIRSYASRSQHVLGQLSSHLKEVLVGVRIVKGFGKEAFEAQKLERQNQSFFSLAMREILVVTLTSPVISTLGMLVIIAFIVYGSLTIQDGAMSQGAFFTYVLVIYQLYQPTKRIARNNAEIQQAIGVLPRVYEILQWENEILEPAQPQRPTDYPQFREISFDGIYFHYQGQAEHKSALQNVSFKVQQGEVVALVGPSGSGKTSLINLLPRFYDVTQGSISIDGLDIRSFRKQDLRQLMAIVTQDTILFDDTVANNIAYGMEAVPLAQIQAAAQKAFADGFIRELEQGYDTLIGECGDRLSGGQRQRLSIARAILKDAPILILDEATSALDTESEREVQMALDNLMARKTTFVVAHRLSTIRRADRIFVLENGHLVESGNHASLMAHEGVYYKLVKMQEEGLHVL